MYLKHYSLSRRPFKLSSDPDFLWTGEKQKAALEALKEGILENKGFVLLTGEVGTGKTTLVNAFPKLNEIATITVTIMSASSRTMKLAGRKKTNCDSMALSMACLQAIHRKTLSPVYAG